MADDDDLFAAFCDAVATDADRRNGVPVKEPPKPSAELRKSQRPREVPRETRAPAVVVAAPEPAVKEVAPGPPLVDAADPEPLSEVRSLHLRRHPELVLAAKRGHLDRVQQLLASSADPNVIEAEEERIKGSECCAGAMITMEECTPLVAACMGEHIKVVEALLEWPGIDVNVVCCGYDEETGPYKYYTALDVVSRQKGPSAAKVLGWLQGRGAQRSDALPPPPWPRPEAQEIESSSPPEAAALANIPTLPPEAPGAPRSLVRRAQEQILQEMRQCRLEPRKERAKLLKQWLLEWHPDKRPPEEQELATAVSQWLNGPARCFAES